MVDFKRVGAADNPDPDKIERGREAKRRGLSERDVAELDRQQAQERRGAVTDNDRDLVEQSTRRGGGAAGLNTGPSDTISGDPHSPVSNQPLRGPDLRGRDGGTGRSPPQGAAVTTDKPAGRLPAVHRAAGNASPEARQAGQEAQRAADQARQDERRAEDRAKGLAGQRDDGTGEAGTSASVRKGGFYSGPWPDDLPQPRDRGGD